MGDNNVLVPAEKSKSGGGSSSIVWPMLNAINYTVWTMRMKVCLKVHEVWEVIEGETKDNQKKNIVMTLVFQYIPEDLILQVGELDMPKKLWEAIKTRNIGVEHVKEARLQTLISKFDRLKMKETESIDDFVAKLSAISSKSSSLGVKIEETKLVKKFLKCLSRKKYILMVASLEKLLDLKITSFEDDVGRLKTYKERILEED